jgi:hypothetical protein
MSNRMFIQIAALILLAGGVFWGISRLLDWQRQRDMMEVIDRNAPPLNELVSPYPPAKAEPLATPPGPATVNEVLEEADAALKESERASAAAENALRNAR